MVFGESDVEISKQKNGQIVAPMNEKKFSGDGGNLTGAYSTTTKTCRPFLTLQYPFRPFQYPYL
jgi:hypothetical protein